MRNAVFTVGRKVFVDLDFFLIKSYFILFKVKNNRNLTRNRNLANKVLVKKINHYFFIQHEKIVNFIL